MYKKLPIPQRKSLIVFEEVVTLAPTENDVARKQLEDAIQIAEERFVRPKICAAFYNDFRERKNVMVTVANLAYIQDFMEEEIEVGDVVNAIEFVDNEWYVLLWYEHLWKLTAEAVMYIASPTNYSRFTASGEMLNNPQVITGEGRGASSVDLGTMKWKHDRMLQDRIAPLVAGMDQWLYGNRVYFPAMDCKQWNYTTTSNGVALHRKTPWIHGVYPLVGRGKCYSCRDQVWGDQYPTPPATSGGSTTPTYHIEIEEA
jgi:hypothetical protein